MEPHSRHCWLLVAERHLTFGGVSEQCMAEASQRADICCVERAKSVKNLTSGLEESAAKECEKGM